VHGAAGRLPRVVRGARTERRLVLGDTRIASDLFRALRVPEEIRIVALHPHENEVCGGHEVRDERTALRGTRERISAHAEPAAVVVGVVFLPELFFFDELELDAPMLHARKASDADSGPGVRGIRARARADCGCGPGYRTQAYSAPFAAWL
jgi:hypothetical protein